MNHTSRRQDILDQMASITRMERGKLSPMSSSSPRFRLQCWHDGANRTLYVPAAQLEAVRSAVANHERFQALANEFVDVTVAATRAERIPDSKKNGRNSSRNASRKPKPS